MLRRAESIPDRHSFDQTPVELHHETSRFPIGYDEAVQGDTDRKPRTECAFRARQRRLQLIRQILNPKNSNSK